LEEEITLKDEGKYKNALDVPPCASGVQNNEKNHCIQHTRDTHDPRRMAHTTVEKTFK